NGGSRVSFNAVAGTVYRISVRGVGGASGVVLLNWDQPNGRGVDLLPDLFVWPNAAQGFLYGWYLDQLEPTQPGRTLMRVSTATPNIGAGPLELRGSSTEAGVYQRIYRTDGTTTNRYAGTFTFHPGHGHLHFDNWINLHLRTVLVNDGVGDIVASGDKTSFAIIDLMNYNSTLPGHPSNPVYFGGLVQGLSVGYADVYGAGLLDQWIDVTDVPSGRYWLEGIVDPANSILESNESNNLARILINYVNPNGTNRPVNDHFTNAIELLTITAGALGHNTNATLEPGEPLHLAGSTTGHSVWWNWTAPSDMMATLTTDGSSFDTVLAVYVGPAYGALTKLASDNDSGAGNNSLVTFAATAGTTYHIAVSGLNTAFGRIQLNVNPALNDQFANCLPISGASGSATVSTLGATRQSGEPNHAGIVGTNSVWFCWTAPDSGPWILDTYGSTFDTLLAVYTGSALNALTTIAANNDLTVGVPISRVNFTAVSNTTYRIAVDGRAGASGSGLATLNWTGPTPPRITAQPQSTNVIAGATVTFNVTAAGTVPLSYQWLHAGTNLIANSRYLGTTSSQLRLQKVLPTDMGDYSVLVSNTYGMATSAPAFLIVLDNPRVVYIDEATAPIGGVAIIPIEMQSLGDESLVRFTLAFDPALLLNARVTNSGTMSAAALTVNTTQVSSGRLGVSMSLPTGQSIPAGSHQELVHAYFDVTNTAANGTVTSVGFENAPTTRGVILTNGLAAVTLFAAGPITLTTGEGRVLGERLPDGTFRISVLGLAGGNYEIQASSDLQNWTELTQLTADPQGGLEFIDPQSTVLQHRFYRAMRLAP
ncbi:MAG TPA: lysyl oxidase family protein, partial [Verrucomicrobiae bacterium]|nr:lysyl oxidase family protein [Verrucomicrobiae bacterium]